VGAKYVNGARTKVTNGIADMELISKNETITGKNPAISIEDRN
jgi:hypothetical protein